MAAVETICKLAQTNPDLMTKELLLEAGMRMRDKKVLEATPLHGNTQLTFHLLAGDQKGSYIQVL